MSRPATPLLDLIGAPADLRRMDEDLFPRLAAELRAEVIDAVSLTGGHLGASLGVVELTIALHAVFDTPEDRLIWDVGHQTYPHKILTGRRGRIGTLRQAGGLSGFTQRAESVYDPFGAAHASTSISAGLGMAIARDLSKERRNVVCVIGDGAMSAGMAYEAMNHAGSSKSRLIVVLNDNDMSIARPVGAMSAYLARLASGEAWRKVRDTSLRALPSAIGARAHKALSRARELATGGGLFEELGFRYYGPLDGHDFRHLVPVLRNAKEADEGPILIHAVTRKGKGYPPAERAEDKFHGVDRFDVSTGRATKPKAAGPSWTRVFADALVAQGHQDSRIVAITAAMPAGSGVDAFAQAFPDRAFDVGIAEQHAVTFAAGLASQGARPFCAIYSTFLQRAYDQVVHDVAIQRLPVRFAIDRAGLVGADGPTHAGAFDTTMLAPLPGFVLMAAGDERDLARMVATAAAYDEGPIAFRYPRGVGPGVVPEASPELLTLGKGRVLREGVHAAVLSYGARLGACLAAAEACAEGGMTITVADARFAKPLDEALLLRLAREHPALLVVEEGAEGGFGSLVLGRLAALGLLDSGRLRVRMACLPDRFQPQATPDAMLADAGLDADSLARALRGLVAPANVIS